MNEETKHLVKLMNSGYSVEQTQLEIYKKYNKWITHDNIILMYIKYFNKIFKIVIIKGKMYLRKCYSNE